MFPEFLEKTVVHNRTYAIRKDGPWGILRAHIPNAYQCWGFSGIRGGEDSSVMIGSEITVWEILKEGYYRSTEKRSRK